MTDRLEVRLYGLELLFGLLLAADELRTERISAAPLEELIDEGLAMMELRIALDRGARPGPDADAELQEAIFWAARAIFADLARPDEEDEG